MSRFPGIHYLTEVRRRFGLRSALQGLTYGAARRIAGLHLDHILLNSTTDIPTHSSSEIEYRFLSPDDVRRFASDPENDLDANFYKRLLGTDDLCFAAIVDGELLNYGWYALNSIESEHCSGVSASFSSNVAYFYKSFTHPQHRGRGINEQAIRRALSHLATLGVDNVFGLVEFNNFASLRSCTRAGFRPAGRLTTIRWAGRQSMYLAGEARTLGILFGPDARIRPRPS